MAARRIVGLVPQEINFDPFFTPREVLRFQMGYFGVPPSDARIDELLAALALTDKADVTSRELSGGMRRRLLIAKALVHRPRVAFLDEPTAGVDIALRRDLWSLRAQAARRGHDDRARPRTTSRRRRSSPIASRVIDRGELIAVDKPAVLLRAARQASRRSSASPSRSPVPLPDEAASRSAPRSTTRARRSSCPIERRRHATCSPPSRRCPIACSTCAPSSRRSSRSSWRSRRRGAA